VFETKKRRKLGYRVREGDSLWGCGGKITLAGGENQTL
jgi:hypothetical protein